MAFGKKTETNITIAAPDYRKVQFKIRGTANYVMNAFAQEAVEMMRDAQMKGQQDKKRGAKKPPKDFDASYKGSLHIDTEDRIGIPCVAIKAAMVRAAQLCGIAMTQAKMTVFIEPDSFDGQGNGLVLFTKGEVERFDSYVRNANGSADIRARGRVPPGWEAVVTIKFDHDFMSTSSVANLLARAGLSVGVGAGRPFSTNSVGQGWGTFDVDPNAVNEVLDKAAE